MFQQICRRFPKLRVDLKHVSNEIDEDGHFSIGHVGWLYERLGGAVDQSLETRAFQVWDSVKVPYTQVMSKNDQPK